MEPRWYESAVKELEDALEAGQIDDATYRKEMRELNWELRDAAAEHAQAAYDDYMGGW